MDGARSTIRIVNLSKRCAVSLSVTARGSRSTGEIETGSRFSLTLFGRCAVMESRYAAAFITSAFGSYSGCRQYLEDIARAQQEVGEGAPDICRLRFFHTDPAFVDPLVRNIRAAMAMFATPPHIAFTAHSVPVSMADTSPYVTQLTETCAVVAERLGHTDWKLVYQSRSGPPGQPWLEPDIGDHIRALHAQGRRELVIMPVGFLTDHMEVIYDLDTEAAVLCEELGIRMERAKTVGAAPEFVRLIRDLLLQPCKVCEPDCCPRPQRRL